MRNGRTKMKTPGLLLQLAVERGRRAKTRRAALNHQRCLSGLLIFALIWQAVAPPSLSVAAVNDRSERLSNGKPAPRRKDTVRRSADDDDKLVSVVPASARQGEVLQVTLRGRHTEWRARRTFASLGGEIAVGGAPYGQLGPVTV